MTGEERAAVREALIAAWWRGHGAWGLWRPTERVAEDVTDILAQIPRSPAEATLLGLLDGVPSRKSDGAEDR